MSSILGLNSECGCQVVRSVSSHSDCDVGKLFRYQSHCDKDCNQRRFFTPSGVRSSSDRTLETDV